MKKASVSLPAMTKVMRWDEGSLRGTTRLKTRLCTSRFSPFSPVTRAGRRGLADESAGGTHFASRRFCSQRTGSLWDWMERLILCCSIHPERWYFTIDYAVLQPLKGKEKAPPMQAARRLSITPWGRRRRGRSPFASCSKRPALPGGRGVSALARKHSDSFWRKRSLRRAFPPSTSAAHAGGAGWIMGG